MMMVETFFMLSKLSCTCFFAADMSFKRTLLPEFRLSTFSATPESPALKLARNSVLVLAARLRSRAAMSMTESMSLKPLFSPDAPVVYFSASLMMAFVLASMKYTKAAPRPSPVMNITKTSIMNWRNVTPIPAMIMTADATVLIAGTDTYSNISLSVRFTRNNFCRFIAICPRLWV